MEKKTGKPKSIAGVSSKMVVEEYKKIAFFNAGCIIGKEPPENIPDEAFSAVSSVAWKKDGVEIKFYDKFRALEELQLILGMNSESEERKKGETFIINHCVPRE